MRKFVFAAMVALAALFATPAVAQIDPAKFYIVFPIEAEDHDPENPVFAAFHPFDTKAECEEFRTGGWSSDAEFKGLITEWAEDELGAHEGKVKFLPTYCWSPKEGPAGGKNA